MTAPAVGGAVGRPASAATARSAEGLLGRRGSYFLVVTSAAVLCLTGLVMVLSASAVSSLRAFGTPWWYFERQGAWLCLGVVGFLVAHRVRMSFWQRCARPLVVLSGAGLVAVLVVGRSAGGASRWLGTASVQVQPSEVAKLALVLFAADVLARREARKDWFYRAGPVLLTMAVFGALVIKQPDMGTAVVLCCIGGAALFGAGMPLRSLALLGGLGGLGGLALASSARYRAARITAFLDPFAHASTTGYQSVQSLIALGGGHWFGTGVGQSVASWGYLPNQYTDFIFAVIGQETGFAGTVVLLGLFAAIGVAGTQVAWRAQSTFESLVAAGITAWLLCQAIINVGAVAGVLPVTGVPLPFVSYGGSSLVIVLFATGLLANVARGSLGARRATPARPRVPVPAGAPEPGRRAR